MAYAMNASQGGSRTRPHSGEDIYEGSGSRYERQEEPYRNGSPTERKHQHNSHRPRTTRYRQQPPSSDQAHEGSRTSNGSNQRNWNRSSRVRDQREQPREQREQRSQREQQRDQSFDYDDTVNNWTPRTDHDRASYSARSSSRTWTPARDQEYTTPAVYPEASTWPENYDSYREPTYDHDRWPPPTHSERSRPPHGNFEHAHHSRQREGDWSDDHYWPPQSEQLETRKWISRDEVSKTKHEDRSWQPASTWRSPTERRTDHNNTHNTHNTYIPNNTQTYPNQKRHRSKQDKNQKQWHSHTHYNNKRDDGDTLRRRQHTTQQARTTRRSPSYSSPPTRSRSRTRSLTPKRRRMGSSPPPTHRPSGSKREARGRELRRSPTPPSPQYTFPETQPSRHQSHSPLSTPSRSPSPIAKDAGIHRLPLTSHTSQARTADDKVAKSKNLWPDKKRKGKSKANGNNQRQREQASSPSYAPREAPNFVPGFTEPDDPLQQPETLSEQNTIQPLIRMVAPTPVILQKPVESSSRNVPLPSTNDAAVRRFFPDDEQQAMDMDAPPQQSVSLPPETAGTLLVPVPGPSTIAFQIPREEGDGNEELHIDRTPSEGSMSLDSLVGDDTGIIQSRPRELFDFIREVGEGTFGKVFKARDNSTGRFVALKRIRMEGERDGFPITAMREIKLLQALQHPNIVELHGMMVTKGQVHMVLGYMDHDLTGILGQSQFAFTDANLKSLCLQMLSGLAYLHQKGVIHRDIKGSNILVNSQGELRLGDFGLARLFNKRRRSDYTNRVITLWYRPPELLLGATVYGPEVDLWSAGCIMLELFTKKPVFQGDDELHQLDVLYKILGTPNRVDWPGVNELPWFELVKPGYVLPNRFRDLFQRWLSPAGIELAQSMLLYDPIRRATASEALTARYFREEEPAPDMPSGLADLPGEWHEFEHKREKAKRKRLDM